jgi:hypothetical protein
LGTKYVLFITTVFVITILRALKEVACMLGMMALEIFHSQPFVLFLSICRLTYAKQPKVYVVNGWMDGGEYKGVRWRGKA